MVVVVVFFNNKFYVVNVGINCVFLCKLIVDGLQVIQLNVDYIIENEDEFFCFLQLGLDVGKIKQVGIICGQESIWWIGDYKVKYGYMDIDFFSVVKFKLIIVELEIYGVQLLDGVMGFLVLMLEGLYKVLEVVYGFGQVNQEIVVMIDIEFVKQIFLDVVVQVVVDWVKCIYSDIFVSGGECVRFCFWYEDMILLVRNFGYLLGEMSQFILSLVLVVGG